MDAELIPSPDGVGNRCITAETWFMGIDLFKTDS